MGKKPWKLGVIILSLQVCECTFKVNLFSESLSFFLVAICSICVRNWDVNRQEGKTSLEQEDKNLKSLLSNISSLDLFY